MNRLQFHTETNMGWRKLPSQHAVQGSRRLPNDLIGERLLDVSVTATRIEGSAADPDVLVFGEEVPLAELVAPREAGSSRTSWRRFRFEFRSRDAVLRGQHLALAWVPYSLQYFASAEFRPPMKKKRDGVLDDLTRAGDLAERLDGARREPFESDDWFTAALSEPPASFDPSDTRRLRRPQAYYLGLSEDARQAALTLTKDPKVRGLWAMTESRTLQFAKVPGVKLHSDLVEECHSLLFGLSVNQALAGPGKRLASWQGRRVADLVERIYKSHVNNLSRREAARRGRLERLDDD